MKYGIIRIMDVSFSRMTMDFGAQRALIDHSLSPSLSIDDSLSLSLYMYIYIYVHVICKYVAKFERHFQK